MAQAVQEAKRACTDWSQRHPSRRTPLVAGSVGPYGAFLADGSEYTGDYALSGQQYQDFHRVRMQVMAESGVDLFAFETMPNIGEVKALTGLLRDEFPNMTAWLSFSLSENGDMADGTDLAEAVSYIQNVSQIEAVGVNCVPMDRVLPAIRAIRQVTDKPIIVYPNNGDIYDPKTKTWSPNPTGSEPAFAHLVPQWIDVGARLIGGCCRTTPDDIRTIAHAASANV
uniref:homocysteine S-methyltransferase n=1 Tax=Bifidobacterium adolescentis TaxID=1680 RepID=UPI00359C585F